MIIFIFGSLCCNGDRGFPFTFFFAQCVSKKKKGKEEKNGYVE